MMDVKDLKRLMDAMASADVAELEFEWEPNIYYISNGSEEIFAVIEPETGAEIAAAPSAPAPRSHRRVRGVGIGEVWHPSGE